MILNTNAPSAKEVICSQSVSEACFLLINVRPTLRNSSEVTVTCRNLCVMFVCSEIRSNLGYRGCFRRTVCKILVENMKGEGRFLDLSVDGRIMSTWTRYESMDWTDLAQKRDNS